MKRFTATVVKKSYEIILFTFVIGLTLSACSIIHTPHSDYCQYLKNNEGKIEKAQVAQSTSYVIDTATQNHRYEFRSVMTGAANLWVVEFGKILDTTLESKDYRNAFKSLAKAGPTTDSELLINFHLNDYKFEGFQAKVNLSVKADYQNKTIVDKTYEADGISQGGKMFWGGVFAMKNAIQQSTKSAVDEILLRFIVDFSVVRLETCKQEVMGM